MGDIYGDWDSEADPCSGGTWAGYFEGEGYTASSWVYGSDQMLKENVADLSISLDIIAQLNPKSYTFKRTEYPYLSLSDGTNYGLIALEVETALPDLVANVTHFPETDLAGNVVSPMLKFKGLKYTEFIPFLIGGIQE